MGYLESNAIIGHDALCAFLARSLRHKRHHAYLLAGAEHLGKDTVARAMVADELNRPVKGWGDLAAHPDIRVLAREEGEKNIGIASVRSFIGHFASSSMLGGRKIGVLSGAHNLSAEAANALLKTLEEPTGKALIVLVADSLDRLPETIKSRCQLVRFLSVPAATIESGLVKRGFMPAQAASASAFAAGRPGLAVRHAEDSEVRAQHAECVGSLIDLVSRPLAGRLRSVGEMAAKAESADLQARIDAWISALRDLVAAKTGNDRFAADPAGLERLRPYGQRRSLTELVMSLRRLLVAKRLLAENVNSRLIFENIAINL
jgi:DNA polymerase III subunit delta'